jgi:hypothetical protein
MPEAQQLKRRSTELLTIIYDNYSARELELGECEDEEVGLCDGKGGRGNGVEGDQDG